MRRGRALVVLLAVVAVAAGSTAHATRREAATDRAARAAAVKGATVALLRPEDQPFFVELPKHAPSYGVSLRNDAPGPIVLRTVSWYDGLTADVQAFMSSGDVITADLPQPPCPTRRATRKPDAVTVTFDVAGVEKTQRLALTDRDSPVELLNNACGLYRASESNAHSVQLVRSRPGEVVVDVEIEFYGSRDTVVQALRAADGVAATVAEAFPVTLRPQRQAYAIRDLGHLATVTLRLTDCAALVASLATTEEEFLEPTRAPGYRQLQLTVQRAGDDVERLNVNLGVDATNALTAPCRPQVPPLVEEVAG